MVQLRLSLSLFIFHFSFFIFHLQGSYFLHQLIPLRSRHIQHHIVGQLDHTSVGLDDASDIVEIDEITMVYPEKMRLI